MIAGAQDGRKQKSHALLVSLGLHLAAFLTLLQAPAIELPRASENEYKQAIQGKEEKIVWYKFRKELPAVNPEHGKAEKRPLRAETVSKQSIVSAPQKAPKRDQMVWTPAPEIAAVKPVESANILAIRLPDQTFTAPPVAPVKPAAAPQLASDAPALTPVQTDVPAIRTALPPRPFQPPKAAERTRTEVAPLAEAPALAPGQTTFSELRPVLPPRPFQAPAVAKRVVTEVAPLADAPQLAANLTSSTGSLPAQKLPARPFAAPPGPASARPARGVTVDTPPPMEANSRDLNVAVVGLNPVDKLAPPPSASTPGAFSSGPKLNPDGALSEGAGRGLTVPDLFVRGPREPSGSRPDLLAQAYAAPTSKETLRAAMRGGEPVMSVRVPPEPAVPTSTATKVSGAPDPRFNGRDIFLMAIQMPNLTSYSGSWLMWYADHTAREAGLAPIAAPVPHRKVDPKYVATAVEERIEGNITLGCVIDEEGKVSGVELIRGLDSRLNATAQEALAKWEFYPARRNGVPVVVDVLVQIPFRLAPKPARR